MHRIPLHDQRRIRMTSLIAAIMVLLPLVFLPVRNMIFLSQSGEIRKLEPNSGKLERMVFTSEAFSRLNFTRSQREFVYRGNMYDIHSIRTSGDQVVVLVLWDTVESQLLQAFQYKDKTEGPALRGSSEMGFMPYFQVVSFHPGFFLPAIDPMDYQDIPFKYSNPYTRICSPPPEWLTYV